MSTENLSLDDAQQTMSKAIRRIEKIIDSEDDSKATNAANCLSGLVSRYAKLIETVELEKRISKLEEQQKIMRKVS